VPLTTIGGLYSIQDKAGTADEIIMLTTVCNIPPSLFSPGLAQQHCLKRTNYVPTQLMGFVDKGSRYCAGSRAHYGQDTAINSERRVQQRVLCRKTHNISNRLRLLRPETLLQRTEKDWWKPWLAVRLA
jgi:hypothetical protein